MNEDLENIHYSRIRNFRYAQWFEKVQYNRKTLSDAERKDFVAVIDETIALYSEGLPLIQDSLESDKDKHGDYYIINRTVVSVMQFVLIAMIDCMVVSKYFILADKDYDRRFMRGKLMVILNEGFKRLYGFEKSTYEKSEWNKLLPILKYFPEQMNLQYQDLTYLLQGHSTSSSWWKKDRDPETHLDAELLYFSRQEAIVESRVIMDTMKLFSTLMAINNFLTNVNACLVNSLVEKYYRGELRNE